MSGTTLAKKYGIANSTTDMNLVFEDKEVDAVIITTQHHQHCEHVVKSIKAQKHVFVEKPLALTYEELSQIEEAYYNANVSLTVGFNRRFSPLIQKAKSALGNANQAINVIANMNAGFIPQDRLGPRYGARRG